MGHTNSHWEAVCPLFNIPEDDMLSKKDISKVGPKQNESYSPVVTSINNKIVVIGGTWKWGPLFDKQQAANKRTA